MGLGGQHGTPRRNAATWVMRPVARHALKALAVLGLAFALLALFASNRLTGLFFGPLPDCPPPPAEAGVVERVTIEAVDGTLMEGWYFAARRDPGLPPRGVVVHAHGNAFNLSFQWRGAKWLSHRGYEVLAFDYRGFGNSSGRPTRGGAIEDVGAAIEWARERAASRRLPVILFGQSVGAALSLEAGGAREDLAALVLDSPFDSWPGVAAANLARSRWTRAPLRLGLGLALHRSGPDLSDVAAGVRVPLFIVSGGADGICPPAMARNLATRAGCQLLEIENARHVGQRDKEQGRQVHDAIIAFLDGALRGRP
jgi:alpha-beta hydrolase superfamily lysophospholipase